MSKKMEVRELLINEVGELGVDAISFVDMPATQVNFFTFKAADQEEAKRFCFDEERRIVTGVAMVPDMPIYRKDDTGEYYVKFSKETIEQISVKFFKNNFTNNTNMMHNTGNNLDGVTLFESFIVDSRRGVQALSEQEAIDGTWIVSYKIENDSLWNDVKSGKFKGFSVEGLFDQKKIGEDKPQNLEKEVNELLSNFLYTFKKGAHYFKDTNKMSDKNKTFKDKFDAATKALSDLISGSEQTFLEIPLKDGSKVVVDTETLGVGSVITIVDGEETKPLADGSYELEDGSGFIILSGKVSELVPAPEEMKKEIVDHTEQIAKMELTIKGLETKLSESEKKNATQAQKMDAQIKAMFSVIKVLSENETGAPVEKRTGFSENKKDSHIAKLKDAFKIAEVKCN